MNTTFVYVMMAVLGLCGLALPFIVFMGLGTLLGVGISDTRLFVIYVLGALVFTYLSSLGAFALVQKSNCGSVKNMKQVATNAGIATAINGAVLLFISVFPSLRRLVTNLLPPDVDPLLTESIGYAYYGLWAALFGTSVGGTLSGICAS
jgi:hypothetical protein